jgi:hypothetical protein
MGHRLALARGEVGKERGLDAEMGRPAAWRRAGQLLEDRELVG